MKPAETPQSPESVSLSKASLKRDFLRERAFAEMFDVGVWTVRSWDRKGIGPPLIRIGRQRWYRKAAVAAWLARREKPCCAPEHLEGHAR